MAAREQEAHLLGIPIIVTIICKIAVDAMHVLGGGALYSWGCSDDGALGRAPSDGWDVGPSDVVPHQATMPSLG